jgi:hypothetical protein
VTEFRDPEWRKDETVTCEQPEVLISEVYVCSLICVWRCNDQVTVWTSDELYFDSRQGQKSFFLLSEACRPPLGPTQPAIFFFRMGAVNLIKRNTFFYCQHKFIDVNVK